MKRQEILSKTLETLIVDIDALHTKGHQPTDESIQELANEIAGLVARSLSRNLSPDRDRTTLRMSNIGKPARQLWYQAQGEDQEELTGQTLRKFLMGDLWESLLLWLAKEAGHSVENQQGEVNVDGVVGHIDAVVDGVVVDVKSASKFGFEKFRRDTLRDDDAFGYYDQLGGYSTALDLDGAWLAVNKETAALTVLHAPKEELAALDTRGRIAYMRDVLKNDNPPERCYEPVPDGKSGNLKLPVGCSYCPFKFKCWADANHGAGPRTFLYSNGPTYLVHVEKEPNVPEGFVVKKENN